MNGTVQLVFLVVEPEAATRGLLLEGLERAGHKAVAVETVAEALETVEALRPSVIITDLDMAEEDPAALTAGVRELPFSNDVPIFVMTSRREATLPDAVAIGAQDLLKKPLFVRDVITLGRLQGGRPATSLVLDGRIEDVGMAHMLRALVSGLRAGRLLVLEGEGEVLFTDGRIVDAHFHDRTGERALLHLLTVTEGPWHVAFEETDPAGPLSVNVDGLLLRGFPYVRLWEQVVGTLPPLATTHMVVDLNAFIQRLQSIPDGVAEVVRLFDGHRTLDDVVEDAPYDDLTSLRIISRLDALGLLLAHERGATPTSPGNRASDELFRVLYPDEPLPQGGREGIPSEPPGDWFDPYDRENERFEDIIPEADDT